MTEIKLDFLIKVFKKSIWKLVIVAVIAMILVASFTHFFIPKTYSSSVKFYVININADYDYTSSSVISAVSYLVNDYISIIKSDRMLDLVVDKLKEDGYPNITKGQINSMISSSTGSETSVFTLKISSTDSELAYKVASILAEYAPATVTDVAKSTENSKSALADKILIVIDKMELTAKDGQPISNEHVESVLNAFGLADQSDCMKLITPPTRATTHDSPNLPVYTLLGGIVAAMIAYVILVLNALFNQTIVTEEDVKQYTDHPVIGVIPHWESEQKN